LKRVTVNLEDYLHREIKIAAAKEGSTLNDIMIEAAKMFLQNKSKYR
tara:strand:+ start:830 stop:970 length:141 start_codon:yes stop_codon:yes gene_type:complete